MSDWDELEAAAKAATPGPWRWSEHRLQIEPPKLTTRGLQANIEPPPWGKADFKFIALANPETVLRLIAEVRRLEKNASRTKASCLICDGDGRLDVVYRRQVGELVEQHAAAEREMCAKIADTKERASRDTKRRRAQEAAGSQELSYHEGAETMAIAIAAAIRSGDCG